MYNIYYFLNRVSYKLSEKGFTDKDIHALFGFILSLPALLWSGLIVIPIIVGLMKEQLDRVSGLGQSDRNDVYATLAGMVPVLVLKLFT